MNRETQQLIRRASEGDMDAFAETFEPLRGMVYAVAYRLVGPDEADDVVMETYLKAWQALPRFRGQSSLKTWLYRIAYNCALDMSRARRRRKEQALTPETQEQGTEAHLRDDRQETPDTIMAREETVDAVREASAKLSPAHRVALELRYSDGFSYSEIAAATGVSIGTVMSRLFNAKRKLRQLMEVEDAS